MSKNVRCSECRYFYGFDGVGELWTGCSKHGDFKGTKTNCESFEKKVTKADLLKKIHSLENTILSLENEVTRQRNQIKLLNKQFSKIPPKIREVWLND